MSFIIKQELHQLIDKCNDESLLEDAKLLFQEQDPSYDWWDDLSEEDKNLVGESDAQYERGEFITFSELMSQLDAKKKQ
jgi:hypothetical protein